MKEALRMAKLPPYLFTIVDGFKKVVRKEGREVIDLSMGNPDLPTPKPIIDKLCKSAYETANHRYSKRDEACEVTLREAIASWYKERFSVNLDPETEVVPLIGSKEGIAHLSTAFLNPDDVALVPSPSYPVHFNGVIMSGGTLHSLPLLEENNYLPDLDRVPSDILNRSKLMFLSYPHNPTTAVADRSFYEDIVAWNKDKQMILTSDAAYSDIVYDDYKATSLLQIEGAKETSIEIHTLSKSYNMAGWRLGFAVGNATILSVLEKTKSYTDFGIFRPIQRAAVEALTGDQSCVTELVSIYKERMDFFIEGLNRIGWPIAKPKATFYIWSKIPAAYRSLSSLEFVEKMIKQVGVAVAPGSGFGESGEGYVRFALVQDIVQLDKALTKIDQFLNAK